MKGKQYINRIVKQWICALLVLVSLLTPVTSALPGAGIWGTGATASALSDNLDDILFDWHYYYEQYADLRNAFGKDAEALRKHYIDNGKREGRTPSALFDPKYYVNTYPDLKNDFGNKTEFGNDYVALYDHFKNNGIMEGRQGSANFNVQIYRDNYLDLRNAFGVDQTDHWKYLKHWREFGSREGRNATNRLPGWYMIESGNSSDRVLDIAGRSMDNGGNLTIYQKLGSDNQQFYVDYNKSTDSYTIKAKHSGKYLHKSGSGSNVHQWEGNSHNNAKWHLEPAGNGYYYLRNENGNYLDNNGGYTNLGNNVQTYSFNKSLAQKWKLIPPDYEETTYWQWPVNDHIVTQGFGSYYSPMANKGRPYHCGMDLVNSVSRNGGNPPIYAAASGTVKYKGSTSGNGNHIIIQHSFNNKTVYTLYSHLKNFDGCPNLDQPVSRGQQIGCMGNTGNSSGTHLHFGIFTGRLSTDPYGYTNVNNSTKMDYNGITFYNADQVISTNRLP